jgi:hypothetical protein
MAEAPKKGRSKQVLSAEENEAIAEATERLEVGLDRPVKIKPKGKGLVVEIELEDLAQAIEIAKRLA